MIRIFRDRRPIQDINDTRLHELREVLAWFEGWEKEVLASSDTVVNTEMHGRLPESNTSDTSPSVKADTLPKKYSRKSLPSDQCRMDVKCMLYTFEDVCRTHLLDFPDGEVVPSRFNSDPIENHFCQTRGIHGGNLTNPNYLEYCNTVNSIILCHFNIKSFCKQLDWGLPWWEFATKSLQEISGLLRSIPTAGFMYC